MVALPGAAGSTISIVINAVDQFSDTLDTAGDKIKKELNTNAIAAGTAITGLGVAGAYSLFKIAEAAGEAGDVQDAFNKLVGEKGVAALEKMRAATINTVSDVDLMAIANQSAIRGISTSYIPVLTSLSQKLLDSKVATGDVASVMDQLTGALASGRTAALKQLGIVVDEETAYNNYAAAAGITADKLTDLQKKEAIHAEALDQIYKRNKELPAVSAGADDAIKQLTASFDNMSVKLGTALSPAINTVMGLFTNLLDFFNSLSPTTMKVIGIIALLATGLALVGGPILVIIGMLPALSVGFGLLATGIGAVTVAGLPLWAIILAIIAAIAAVIAIVVYWDEIMAWFKKKIDEFKIAMQVLANVVLIAWEGMKLGAAIVVNFIIGVYQKMVDKLRDIFNSMIKMANKIPGVNIPLIPKIDLGQFKIDTATMEERIKQLTMETALLIQQGQESGAVPTQASTPANNAQVNVNIDRVYGTDPNEIADALRLKLGDMVSV